MIAGRYSLDAEIGRGGVGAVWRGRDQVLGRTVALKRIGGAPGGSTPDLLRAEREARLAAQLNHPHVVAVFDLVEEGDQHWLVMEYVEGTNLAELVAANGALTPDEIAPIVAQAADALAAAHTAGIVHRDVKPSNMLVTPDGTVKLTDFGIARTQADAALTQTGLVTGSPAYLSPEVAAGQQATAASDVWSLGASVCHALTGHPPYEVGDNVLGALYRIVHEEPPRPPSAGWLLPLLEGTMTRQPGDRWSAAQVRDFLRAGPASRPVAPAVAAVPETRAARPAPVAVARDQGTQVLAPAAAVATRPSTRPARRTPWGLIALVVIAVLLASVIAFLVATEVARDDGNRGPGGQDGSAASSPSSSSSSGATAAGMQQFIGTYLDTVVSDPEAAFQMLTPEFQEASGGLGGYLGFWADVTSTHLESADADPEALTVRYTYTYTKKGEGSTRDEVTLRLELTNDGDYLIADEL